MVSAIMLETLEQLRTLQGRDAQVLDDGIVVGLASHLSLGQAAEREGIPFRSYSDWLPASDFVQAANEAQELSRTWFTALVGPDAPRHLLEAVRLEIQQAFHEILLAHRVLTHALDELRPGQVVLAPGMDEKVAALVEYEAGQRSIRVVRPGLFSSPAVSVGERALEQGGAAWRAFSQRAGRLLRYSRRAASNARVLAAYRLRQRSSRRPLLLSFGAGVDSVNQQRLMPTVEAQ